MFTDEEISVQMMETKLAAAFRDIHIQSHSSGTNRIYLHIEHLVCSLLGVVNRAGILAACIPAFGELAVWLRDP